MRRLQAVHSTFEVREAEGKGGMVQNVKITAKLCSQHASVSLPRAMTCVGW